MSELKVFELFGNRNGEAIGINQQNKTLNLNYKEVYIKSEADKVIVHHKYKRCLAMARMCEEKSDRYEALQDGDDFFDWGREIEFYFKWYKRWLDLAKKFKEVK